MSNPVKFKDISEKSAFESAIGMVPNISDIDGPYQIADMAALIIVAGVIVVDGITYIADAIGDLINKLEENAEKKAYEKARDTGEPTDKHSTKNKKMKRIIHLCEGMEKNHIHQKIYMIQKEI